MNQAKIDLPKLLVLGIIFTSLSNAWSADKEIAKKSETEAIRVCVVSQVFNDNGRTLGTVIGKIEQAALERADIILFPMECVKTEGETIPGPISEAIAQEAKKYKMYIIANIREKFDGKTYVTSFLCDRSGKIIGKYRKSHKMPDEDMVLGDELPVFETDFGPIAMRIGSDRFFVDIDNVYTAKGARIIFWSQMPEPVEDEYSQDTPSQGRACDYEVFIACARYANGSTGYITNKIRPFCGMPLGRSYVINREGMRIACTPREGQAVAVAVITKDQLSKPGIASDHEHDPAFLVITDPVKPLQKPAYKKRKIRVTAIEDHMTSKELLPLLDEAGKMGSDIVCTYEYVWISCDKETTKEKIADDTREAQKALEQIAEKAKKYNMYIILGGVVRDINYNEGLIYGRDGKLFGRYSKIRKTHDQQITGVETPVFDTDFGRIAIRICADENVREIDRSYGIKGAEILFVPTQSWGPDGIYRNMRDFARAMDTGMFHVEATHPQSELVHRSLILEPTGVPVAQVGYQRGKSIVSAVIDLDNDRPRRYVRDYTPYKPKGYLAEYQPTGMPRVANDLYDVIRQQRRPELYGVLAAAKK